MIKTIPRIFLTLLVAGVVAGFVRLRGQGAMPPKDGGWRELSGPELK